MLTDTSSLHPPRLVVTMDGGWLGIEINLTYFNITWELGLFTKIVIQDAKT